jgi:hypothetical protein
MTAEILAWAVIIISIAACSSTPEAAQRYSIEMTPQAVEENTPLPIELTAAAILEKPYATPAILSLQTVENVSLSKVKGIWRAKVITGRLEYQTSGQNSTTVGVNEEIPIGSSVHVRNNGEIAKIVLDDGTAIMINPATIFNLISVEENTSAPAIRLIFESGSLLIISEDFWVIASDYQFRIRINGSIAGVSYKPSQNTLIVSCFGQKGSCSFFNTKYQDELAPGQQLEYKDSVRGKVKNADIEEWQLLYEQIVQTPTCTPTQRLTPTYTPSPTPTSTLNIILTTPTGTLNNSRDNSRDRKHREEGGRDGGKGG